MSRSLNRCRLHAGWMKPFLHAIQNGYNELNAANMSGVGTNTVTRRVDSDPQFKEAYETAVTKARPRYGHGAW